MPQEAIALEHFKRFGNKARSPCGTSALAARIAGGAAPTRTSSRASSGLLLGIYLEPDRSQQSWGAANVSRRSLMGRAMLLWIIGIPIPIILLIWLLGGFH
jgi:hypothetical protein